MARKFIGTTNRTYMDCGADTPFRLTPVTVAIWVNPYDAIGDSGGNLSLMGKISGGSADGYLLRFNGTPGVFPLSLVWLCFISGAYRIITGGSVAGPGWHHTAGTYDGTTGIAYLDGVSVGTFSQAGTITFAAQNLNINCWAGAGASNQNPGDNILADAAIYNVALAASEVKALAQGARPYTVRRSALVGYWPIDGLASPEPDLSGNAHNGTITGAAGFSAALAPGPPATMFTPPRRAAPFIFSGAGSTLPAGRGSYAGAGIATRLDVGMLVGSTP